MLSRAQSFLAIAVFLLLQMSIFGELNVGEIYRISFADVDGNTFSTAEGRITTVVLTARSNIDKARTVGDRTPDSCLGNSNYRMITVLAFEKNHSKPVRAILNSLVRHRLDSEASRLQSRYDQLKVSRNPRQDVFAVADFDGSITGQLGAKVDPQLFRVFVFGKNGELLKQWNDVPSAEELATALKRD
jgi:hypothetical protein